MSLTENEQIETTKKPAKAEVSAPIAQEPPKQTQLIYCGPHLKGGVLTQYTVYRGDGLPKHLDQHIANCPAIRRLFVTPDQLNKTEQAINTTGTPQNVWFKEIQAYVKGGVS